LPADLIAVKMSRHKKRKFSELNSFPNFYAEPMRFKANWQNDVFKNNNPITLELGCGKGEFSISLAKHFPEKNFCGIDLDGARLWRAAKNAINEGLTNVVFAQANIDKINDIFTTNEVSEIWIPFPDPYPKPSKWKKRLISIVFLERYKQIVQDNSIFHFKTDNSPLFEFGMESIKQAGFNILESSNNLYQSAILNEFNSIPSYFEQIFKAKGETIKYVRFQFVRQ